MSEPLDDAWNALWVAVRHGNDGQRMIEARTKVEAEAVQQWLASDEAERLVYEYLTQHVAQGESADYWQRVARAILARLREAR